MWVRMSLPGGTRALGSLTQDFVQAGG
jgi:hypothetical protein